MEEVVDLTLDDDDDEDDDPPPPAPKVNNDPIGRDLSPDVVDIVMEDDDNDDCGNLDCFTTTTTTTANTTSRRPPTGDHPHQPRKRNREEASKSNRDSKKQGVVKKVARSKQNGLRCSSAAAADAKADQATTKRREKAKQQRGGDNRNAGQQQQQPPSNSENHQKADHRHQQKTDESITGGAAHKAKIKRKRSKHKGDDAAAGQQQQPMPNPGRNQKDDRTDDSKRGRQKKKKKNHKEKKKKKKKKKRHRQQKTDQVQQAPKFASYEDENEQELMALEAGARCIELLSSDDDEENPGEGKLKSSSGHSETIARRPPVVEVIDSSSDDDDDDDDEIDRVEDSSEIKRSRSETGTLTTTQSHAPCESNLKDAGALQADSVSASASLVETQPASKEEVMECEEKMSPPKEASLIFDEIEIADSSDDDDGDSISSARLDKVKNEDNQVQREEKCVIMNKPSNVISPTVCDMFPAKNGAAIIESRSNSKSSEMDKSKRQTDKHFLDMNDHWEEADVFQTTPSSATIPAIAAAAQKQTQQARRGMVAPTQARFESQVYPRSEPAAQTQHNFSKTTTPAHAQTPAQPAMQRCVATSNFPQAVCAAMQIPVDRKPAAAAAVGSVATAVEEVACDGVDDADELAEEGYKEIQKAAPKSGSSRAIRIKKETTAVEELACDGVDDADELVEEGCRETQKAAPKSGSSGAIRIKKETREKLGDANGRDQSSSTLLRSTHEENQIDETSEVANDKTTGAGNESQSNFQATSDCSTSSVKNDTVKIERKTHNEGSERVLEPETVFDAGLQKVSEHEASVKTSAKESADDVEMRVGEETEDMASKSVRNESDQESPGDFEDDDEYPEGFEADETPEWQEEKVVLDGDEDSDVDGPGVNFEVDLDFRLEDIVPEVKKPHSQNTIIIDSSTDETSDPCPFATSIKESEVHEPKPYKPKLTQKRFRPYQRPKTASKKPAHVRAKRPRVVYVTGRGAAAYNPSLHENATSEVECNYNFNISQEAALREQERLLNQSADRLRQQQQEELKFRLKEVQAANNKMGPTFTQVCDPSAIKYGHWKWGCFYARLGLPSNATHAVIKKQYRKFALLYHPDKCQASDAATRFNAITEAYQKLYRGAV